MAEQTWLGDEQVIQSGWSEQTEGAAETGLPVPTDDGSPSQWLTQIPEASMLTEQEQAAILDAQYWAGQAEAQANVTFNINAGIQEQYLQLLAINEEFQTVSDNLQGQIDAVNAAVAAASATVTTTSGYATAAAASASAAATSASAAAGSATTAATQATAAGTARTGAETARDTAITYRDAASGYANSALGYRDAASGYATAAQGYRDTANTYAGNASASATAAAGSATTASTQAGNAASSATAAAGSATLASGYAGTAADTFVPTTSAYSALHYATMANRWANTAKNTDVPGATAGSRSAYHWSQIASDFATAASGYATTASGHATTATTQAGNASASATAAATSATNAANSATAAATAAAAYQAGQCQLTLSGSNLLLSPKNGNKLGGKIIPSAGLTLAVGALAAATVFYIYTADTNNDGTFDTLEASTTGFTVDATTGLPMKTGDNTRYHVGLVRTTATTAAWADTAILRFVRSYYNRTPLYMKNKFTAARTTTSTTWVEMETASRCQFVCYADDIITFFITGFVITSAGSGYSGFGIDGTIDLDSSVRTDQTTVAGLGQMYKGFLSEGYHYVTMMGATSGGTITTTLGPAAETANRHFNTLTGTVG